MMQAARHCSQLAHRAAHAAFGVCLIVAMLVSAGAWRLAQGPVDVSWLTNRARAALQEDAEPLRVTFGSASLAWGGFGDRLEHVIELRLSDVTMADGSGGTLARAPRAWMTFSVPALLAGRFVPRAAEVDDARIEVPGGAVAGGKTDADSVKTDAGMGRAGIRQRARQILAEINGGGNEGTETKAVSGVLEELRRVHVRGARVSLPQPAQGAPLVVSDINLDLMREGRGRLRGSLAASFAVGDQLGGVKAGVDLQRDGDSRLALSVSPLRAASLTVLPQTAAVDLPVSVDAEVTLDPAFNLRAGRGTVWLGAGSIHAGQGAVPVRHGRIDVTTTADTLRVTRGVVDVTPAATDSPTLLHVQGVAQRKADRIVASVALGLDDLNLAALPMIWPPGVGGGARPWIAEHVLAGSAAHGSASFTLEADSGLHGVTLTRATGDVDGSDVTFTWLDKVPAIQRAQVHLRLVDPDSLDITIPSGRQFVGADQPELLIHDGVMHIAGLSQHDQHAEIHVQTEGPLLSALALLKQPRLGLLSEHPIGVDIGAGASQAALDFQFPLEDKLTMDEVNVHARAHLTDVRLPNVVGSHDLDGGTFDLAVTKDGLRMDGEGALAAIPVRLQGTMDFTAGPPSQVVQKVVLTGQPDAAGLAAAGVDVRGFADGKLPTTVTVTDPRRGPESVAIESDLTGAALMVPALGWSKPPGGDARLRAGLSLQHGHLIGIDRFALSGDGLAVDGTAHVADGRVDLITLSDLQLGRTKGHGTIELPPGRPIGIALTASTLDLSRKLAAKSPKAEPDDAPVATSPAWDLDARAGRVILANDVVGSNLVLKARGGGEAIRTLDAVGSVQGGSAVSMLIQPVGGRRHLRIEADDAGTLLRGLDVVRMLRSGRLTVDGWFAAPDRYSPLSGSAVIDNTELTQSPPVAKLLQAMTIYGLADVMRGPGLRFSKVDVPFTYDRGSLIINGARAYNASLGLTARGRIGLRAEQIDADGTVVPAYFFNSMLGGLPLVGKLFSPEKGGGVFAVRFDVTGDLDDPLVTVNPISALTPGFLRNLFPQSGNGGAARPAPRASGTGIASYP